ncbi:MAG: ThuA domain-containing protein [Prolixibacteraceae bacterium]|nr:ThuA domain-containing protein [Prolixibacteraceae bacterium]
MKQPVFLVLIFLIFLSCGRQKTLNVLVFSKTEGFRHESIESGVKMLQQNAQPQNWHVTASEDASIFTDEALSRFDVAVFLSPSGNVLDDVQKAAFERFISKGKGFVGIHGSATIEYDWPWYGRLNGAFFSVHPEAQEARVIIENTNHPAMKPFKNMKDYITFDEWYSFRTNPKDDVNVLITLDESSIKQSGDGRWKMGNHPLAWWREFEGARTFYTGFGHTHESFSNPVIVEHITEAINWAGKRY